MKTSIKTLAGLAWLVASCFVLAAGYLVGVRSLAADAAEMNETLAGIPQGRRLRAGARK